MILVLGAAGVTARLIVDLVEGGPETNSATQLLRAGFLIWLYGIVAFAFVCWELDGGGPEAGLLTPGGSPISPSPSTSTPM